MGAIMKLKLVFIVGSLTIISAAHSAELISPSSRSANVFTSPNFDLSFSIGAMSLRGVETSYTTRGDDSGMHPGSRLSQLKWNTRGAGMAGLTFGWNPLPFTRIEASVHLSFTKDNSRMINTDWLSPDALPDWSDRSLHPDTRNGQNYIADIKIAHQVIVKGDLSGHVLAGFRQTRTAWEAYGGTFVYTEETAGSCASWGSAPPSFNSSSDFRNCVGALDPVAQITYQQTFNTPYLGMRGVYASGSWKVNVDVVGTPFAWSSDRDLHVDMDLYKATYRQQRMLGATLQGSYQLTPLFSLFAEADAQWYFNQAGVLKFLDLKTGEAGSNGKASAGTSLETTRFSAGLKATF